MDSTIIITPHVIDTVKALPQSERTAIAGALASELLLGTDPDEGLTPFQAMLYSVIRYYVKRDSERHRLNQYTTSNT